MSHPATQPQFVDNGAGLCWHCGRPEAEHDVLREVAEALEALPGVASRPPYVVWRADGRVDVRKVNYRGMTCSTTAEDVLQALPEHLQGQVVVTRVASGRFVVEEVGR